MDHRAQTWYRQRTSRWQDWPLAALLDAKQRHGARISVVMPARNEEQTVAEIAHAIEMGADAAGLALTIHPHPTLPETVGLAAEAFEGTITDLYLPRKK
jgi:pyruvate/2-oxoglutarate dehydrogenase complex dihydrolipoamide dehydrogenase (E3) component